MNTITFTPADLDKYVESKVAAEREACADIADKCNTNMFIADTIAAKIRARSTADGKQAEPVGPTEEKS